MNNYNQVKEQYISFTLLHSKASAEGDYRTANKAAKALKNIYKKIESKYIDKTMLIQLLGYDNLAVKSWAAAHLLGLNYETTMAEKVLENISLLKGTSVRENLEIFSAKMTLKMWKEKGNLRF